MSSLRQHLETAGALAGIALPTPIDALLSALEIQQIDADGRGTVTAGFSATPLFLDLSLRPPGPAIPVLLRTGEADAGFRLWLELAATPPAKRLFDLIGAAPALVLKPAVATVTGDAATLAEQPGAMTITGATLALLIEGRRPEAAMRLVPTLGAPDGLVELFLARTIDDQAAEPSAALIGGTGFGIEFPDGIVIDQSPTASPPAPASGEPSAASADLAWQGLSIPNLAFYLPAGVPVFGDCRVTGRLEIGLSPATGMALTIATTVPPRDGWPALDVRIECIDPAAAGLAGLAPTLVEVAMELPVDQHQEPVSGQGAITFAAGKPLVARARFVRDPTAPDDTTLLSIAIEAQGTGGLISVDASQGMAARLVVAAGAFATAIVADEGPSESADGSGVAIHALLLAALGASAFLQNKGKLVLNGAELISEGRGLPLGGKLSFRLDYSVDVMVKPIGIGSLSVEMKDEQPMRVRMREVVLGFDPAQSGLAKFSLDFGHADMEVEDPGGWRVNGPDSLFDILGTRSGRGSLWFEVDLAFRLDLGPVKVSGATLRATLVDGSPVISLRGLDAALVVPGLLEGQGGFKIDEAGFSASLGASLIPLGASGLATLDVERGDGTTMVLVSLDLDLPGPLPLGASGLALFGVGGTFGIFARPTSAPAGVDPVEYLLSWKPDGAGFEPAAGTLSIGVRMAVGTAPDMGFMLGAVGGVVVTVPDFALRGSLSAKMMGGRPRLVPIDQPIEAPAGLSITGAFLIDPDREVTFGLVGEYSAAPLFHARIPVGGHFPIPNPKDWYVNIGADGCWLATDRKSGPAKLTILPGTMLEKSVRGYFMLRGNGLTNFPFDPLRPSSGSTYQGFVVAFGFAFDWNVGVKPLLWAEVHGGFDVLIASAPLVVAGRGWIGGSLHAGPISVGVDATLNFILAPGHSPYIHAKVCGEIDLWLTSIRKCVNFGIGGDPPTIDMPKPDVHPLDRLEGEDVVGHGAVLVDDQYRAIAPLAVSPDIEPAVWADAIVLLQFAIAPRASAVDGPQFTGLNRVDQAAPTGSDRLFYWWTLERLSLIRIHDDGSEETVAGPLLSGWQAGRFGDTTKEHEAAELALLTREKSLFIRRMPDGGQSLPHDPIGAEAHICEANARAMPGWALGGPATLVNDVWHLPPDIISPDPARSRVEADIGIPSVEFRRGKDEYRIPLRPFGVDDVPPGIDLFAAGTEAFEKPSRTDPPFIGAYWLDGGRRLPEGSVGAPRASVLVRMNGMIHDGMVWLVTELQPIQAHRYLSLTFPQRGSDPISLTPDAVVPLFDDGGKDSRIAVLFKAPIAFDRFRIEYALDCRVGILGIGGVTQAAIDWAATHNQQLADEAAALAAVADAGPQLDPVTAEGLRTILDPGALYRVDIGMSWGASMVQPNGTTKTVDGQPDYAPRDGGDPSASRSYYFRTFPPAAPAPASGMAVFDGRWRFLPPADPFRPELLERHLIGYTPAQAELNWFRKDSLEAHFGVRHVAALAHVYGYDLAVGLQRVDVPGEPGGLRIIAVTLGALSEPALLRNEADRYRFETALISPCNLPSPGMSASVTEELAARAWYDVHVALPSNRDGIPDSRLPGVTFRTSRYRDVGELAQAIGFGFSQAGHRSGDVALAIDPGTLPAGSIVDDDLAFDETMAVLGMEGWPPSTEPRTSLLWWRGATGGWLLGGVLIECPEPVHRPGRCEVRGLKLAMGSAGTAAFDVVRRDRSGSRLLYLTRTPFTPQRWRSVAWPIGRIQARAAAATRVRRSLTPVVAIRGSIGGLIGKGGLGGLGGLEGPGGKGGLRLFQDPRLDLAIEDFAHDPAARTGKLILPTAPSFAGERA
jgi:hypothetical protein